MASTASEIDEQIERLRKGDTLAENEVKALCEKVSLHGFAVFPLRSCHPVAIQEFATLKGCLYTGLVKKGISGDRHGSCTFQQRGSVQRFAPSDRQSQ